ncbi:hypothetical protein AX15_001675 [Amanita polypyramis BW_CC]|nr:hypothetical protein AX15_001675 [Amanita polypyramis BW_CC]
MRTNGELSFTGTLLLVLLFTIYSSTHVGAFDPRSYDANRSKTVACDTVKRNVLLTRSLGTELGAIAESAERVQIQLHYIDVNPTGDATILMVHGWPAVWSTWSYQIEEFKGDYRLIVPSLRGFGKSTHPGNARSSGTMQDNVGDLMCILDRAGVEKAICMGHDWGSQVCYEAARARPDKISAVIGVTIPYVPAGPIFTPVSHATRYFSRLTYQVYFDEKMDSAIAELNKDVRRTLRATYKTLKNSPPDAYLTSKDSFLDAYGQEEISPIEFLTPEEEDYLVEQFEIQGFRDSLQFYTTENRYQSWKFVHDQGNTTLLQPVLTVYSSQDIVADWRLFTRGIQTEKYIPNLTTETVVASHWTHLEDPEAFNKVVRKWLTKLRKGEERRGKRERPADEL